ncbi:hypothetical protein BH23BAC2_BH23BAC2_15850 [soil metagenome]
MENTFQLKKFYFLPVIIVILSFFSCGTTAPVAATAEPAVAQILDEEIRRFDNVGVIHIESTYYNPHIKGFLTAYSNGERMATDPFKNTLTASEITKILNPTELDYLINQLVEPAKLPKTPLMVSRKVILEDLHDSNTRNVKNNQRLMNIDKHRMIISTPIFTRDKQFALVDVSKGKLNSMYTTINLYQREGDGYIYYKTLVGYME